MLIPVKIADCRVEEGIADRLSAEKTVIVEDNLCLVAAALFTKRFSNCNVL